MVPYSCRRPCWHGCYSFVLYSAFRGQTPADAEYNYLDRAKSLQMYGVDLHRARIRVSNTGRPLVVSNKWCPLVSCWLLEWHYSSVSSESSEMPRSCNIVRYHGMKRSLDWMLNSQNWIDFNGVYRTVISCMFSLVIAPKHISVWSNGIAAGICELWIELVIWGRTVGYSHIRLLEHQTKGDFQGLFSGIFDWQMEVELCLFFLLSFLMSNAVWNIYCLLFCSHWSSTGVGWFIKSIGY